MFKVLLAKAPLKFFNELDDKIKTRMLSLFGILETNPWPAKEFDLIKIEGLTDCFRIRVGKFRICYTVNLDSKEITIYRIERRSETTYK
ncbi:type II toxin-antitoxin system RelE/ParE family toxin [Candidatus Micrarchaeota archaeon]|nr:type II toxin-antitoxin system RelE/ParE family toxin [Candidatus Micrarchaeota archaeon]